MATEPLLRVENVWKAFFSVRVLEGVGISLHRGEILALVGANGAGKSTLIKIICGAFGADKGVIWIDGQQQTYRTVREAVAAGVSVAHQHNMTISRLTGAQNIELGREPTRFGLINHGELRRRAEALWREFEVDIDIDAECGDLPPSEQKILDILKALATNPRILILDEPTATLTVSETKRLFAFLDRLRHRDMGIIFISHHLQEVFDHCDRVAVLKDGEMVFEGEVESLTREELVRLMLGRTVDAGPQHGREVRNDVVVSVKGLSVGKLRVESFEVAKGEVVGIAGLIGSGQTEFLQCLIGARKPDQTGTIQIFGKKGPPRSVGDAVAHGVHFIPDDRAKNAMFAALSVEENLSSASLGGLSWRGFFSGRNANARADGLISAHSIRCADRGQSISELSGGNQQKVSFARWLSRPGEKEGDLTGQLFLLDNPTEGVDVGAKAEFYLLIRKLADRGATVIVASVEFQELITVCDRIYCIAQDTLRDHFPAAGMTEEALLLKTNEKVS